MDIKEEQRFLKMLKIKRKFNYNKLTNILEAVGNVKIDEIKILLL